MAVVQISRIQIRRGQKNAGSGLPQLASGELGWAVDTQELFIGNGSVAEGAPAVGNSKVLTQFDNIFALADSYTYRQADEFLLTGGDVNSPVTRSLQNRLDDRISVRSFGLTGQTSQNATTRLQAAIDQLYLNDALKGTAASRVILHLEAGEYIIDGPISIPPYATLVGAGSDKTIIRTLTTGVDMFTTVNSTSIVGSPASSAGTTTVSQPHHIRLQGFSLETTVPNKALVLNNCKDSVFRDVKFSGPWVSGGAVATTDVAIEMNSLSSVVETKNNVFEDCTFNGFAYAVISEWDTHHNTWDNCSFYDLAYGLALSTQLTTLNIAAGSGTERGPYNNRWTNSRFNNINKNAVWARWGSANSSVNNTYNMVGTDGGPEQTATDAVIRFQTPGNISKEDYFGRSKALSTTPGYFASNAYIPEIEGAVTAEFGELHVINTITSGAATTKFRLPGEVGIASQQFDVEYILTSRNYSAIRIGIVTLTVNGVDNSVSLSDTYDYTGTGSYETAISFSATIADADADGTDDTVNVLLASSMPNDDLTQLQFKIKNRKTMIDTTGD
jgi:hypothetical protein|tara:strand:- start:1108 stop:2781 length:1674 start_codon:yes stop_codon:yes gene_type:complete